MIERILYALNMAWRYRKTLRIYRRDATLQISNVLELNPISLKERGFKILILDFDGVLAAYGEVYLSPEIDSWMNFCVQILGEGNVFILSNQATQERANYFAKTFKGVKLIFPAKKKPYPNGILQILQLTKAVPEEVLVVDDRLLTGILATIIANIPGCYVTKPFICLNKRPIAELFFIALRKMERLFL